MAFLGGFSARPRNPCSAGCTRAVNDLPDPGPVKIAASGTHYRIARTRTVNPLETLTLQATSPDAAAHSQILATVTSSARQTFLFDRTRCLRRAIQDGSHTVEKVLLGDARVTRSCACIEPGFAAAKMSMPHLYSQSQEFFTEFHGDFSYFAEGTGVSSYSVKQSHESGHTGPSPGSQPHAAPRPSSPHDMTVPAPASPSLRYPATDTPRCHHALAQRGHDSPSR